MCMCVIIYFKCLYIHACVRACVCGCVYIFILALLLSSLKRESATRVQILDKAYGVSLCADVFENGLKPSVPFRHG